MMGEKDLIEQLPCNFILDILIFQISIMERFAVIVVRLL